MQEWGRIAERARKANPQHHLSVPARVLVEVGERLERLRAELNDLRARAYNVRSAVADALDYLPEMAELQERV